MIFINIFSVSLTLSILKNLSEVLIYIYLKDFQDPLIIDYLFTFTFVFALHYNHKTISLTLALGGGQGTGT